MKALGYLSDHPFIGFLVTAMIGMFYLLFAMRYGS